MGSGTLVMARLLLSTGVGWKSLSRCSNHVTTHQYIHRSRLGSACTRRWRPDHLCTPTQKFLIIMLTRCDAAPYHPRPHPHWRFSHALQSSIIDIATLRPLMVYSRCSTNRRGQSLPTTVLFSYDTFVNRMY